MKRVTVSVYYGKGAASGLVLTHFFACRIIYGTEGPAVGRYVSTGVTASDVCGKTC